MADTKQKAKRERRNAVPSAMPTNAMPEWMVPPPTLYVGTPWEPPKNYQRHRRNAVPNAIPTNAIPNWIPSQFSHLRGHRDAVTSPASEFVFHKDVNRKLVQEYMKSLRSEHVIKPKQDEKGSDTKRMDRRTTRSIPEDFAKKEGGKKKTKSKRAVGKKNARK